MFKEIFSWVILIASHPGKAWKLLAQKEEKGDEYLTRFVYPLIGLMTVAAFLGILFKYKEFDVEIALKAAIKTLVAAFGGYYLASYCLNEISHSMFKMAKNMNLIQRFVGYASSFMFTLQTLLLLLPESDFFFLSIFNLYTFYVIWEGVVPYLQIEENERLKYTSIATALILLIPLVIERVLFLFMPGLRF